MFILILKSSLVNLPNYTFTLSNPHHVCTSVLTQLYLLTISFWEKPLEHQNFLYKLLAGNWTSQGLYLHNWRKLLKALFFSALTNTGEICCKVIFLFLLRHRFSWTLILPDETKNQSWPCRATHLWHPIMVF